MVSKRKKFSTAHFSRGVTLLEMVVVLAIIIILAALGISAFSSLSDNQILDKSVLLATSVLDEARSLTLASKNSSQYGVHFEGHQIVLFTGTTYSLGNSTNQVNDLDQAVTMSSINLSGGGGDVVFDRLTGTTADNGTITFSFSTNNSLTKTITIYATGVVQSN